MTKLVFLVEELSVADLLDRLLPRLFPELDFQCVPHKGKNHLQRSLPRKLRSWREPGVRFVVMQDQDSTDCRQVKTALADLCRQGGREDVLVRVVCRELEAWYVGEPDALGQAFPETRPGMLRELNKGRYKNPDTVVRPSHVIARLIPGFQKRLGARRMADFLSRGNPSRSFQVFVEGVARASLQNAT